MASWLGWEQLLDLLNSHTTASYSEPFKGKAFVVARQNLYLLKRFHSGPCCVSRKGFHVAMQLCWKTFVNESFSPKCFAV